MIRQFIIIILTCLFFVTPAWAHPHAFVECSFSFVMDNKGIAGFRQRWTLDEMTTVSVLDVVDTDRNGVLSTEEKSALRDLSRDSLLEFHFFTVIRINGKDFPVQKITDFTSALNNGRLIYKFFVPCRVEAAAGRTKEVKAAVFDDTFYSFVTYVEEGGSNLDPTKDPLFTNQEAPADPGDFERFSKAVGLKQYNGKVNIKGDATMFKIESKVKEAPEMAYFYKQITPQAFVLAFEPK
ncbi:MAG: DUF1007 family protein [Pseudomonadota bacterium]